MKRYSVLMCLIAASFVSPVRADESNSLIGRWDWPRSDVYYIRFLDNGVFRYSTSEGLVEGRYRILRGGVVEVNVTVANRRIRGRWTNEVKYRVKGDRLEMKLYGVWRSFKRAKSGDD